MKDVVNSVTLLGTKGGPAVRQGGSMPTSSLLDIGGRKILIDCGIGATRSLVESGCSLLELDAIFITHLHSDHVLELGPLVYTAWTTGLARPLPIFGPEGIGGYWAAFLQSMSFDRDIRIEDEGRVPLDGLCPVTPFGEGSVASIGDVAVSALRVDHPPVTECYALKFETGSKSAVFSADTCYFPPLAAFARDADVLVHEAMLLEGVESLLARTPNTDDRLRRHLLASHTPAVDAGRIATEAHVGALVLNHLVPADDPAFGDADWLAETRRHWTGPTHVGHDGMRIVF